MKLKVSKMTRVSLVVLLTVLAFNIVMPVSAGVPAKLQKVMDDPSSIRINAFLFDLKILYPYAEGYYDSDKKAIVVDYPSDARLYIVHGFSNLLPSKFDDFQVPKEVKKEEWAPYLVEAFIDEEEIGMQRYAEPRDFDGDGEIDGHAWRFYHIFEPGDLSVGDHFFDVHWYYREGNNNRALYFAWLEQSTWWYQYMVDPPYDVQALIIRII